MATVVIRELNSVAILRFLHQNQIYILEAKDKSAQFLRAYLPQEGFLSLAL